MENHDIHGYVLAAFSKTPKTYCEIAEGTKMSVRTVEKVARREAKDPKVSTVQKLYNYFVACESKRH